MLVEVSIYFSKQFPLNKANNAVSCAHKGYLCWVSVSKSHNSWETCRHLIQMFVEALNSDEGCDSVTRVNQGSEKFSDSE